jgi:hypothetical protein
MLAVVSIGAQTITVFNGTERIAQAPISSGQPGHRTPTGVFSILQKNRYHESNLYSNAPMPFMQRLTWSGIALHAGPLPGYPASHGCVRLPSAFAERLFGMFKVGTRVVVAPQAATPFPIEHPALPRPIYVPVEQLAGADVAAREAGSSPGLRATPVSLLLTAQTDPTAAAGSGEPLSPIKAAELEKRTAVLGHAQAQRDATARLEAAGRGAKMAENVRRELDELNVELASQRALLAAARRMVAAAVADEDKVQAAASLSVVEEDLVDLMKHVDEVRRAEAVAADAAMASAQAARRAEDLAMRAEAAMNAAQRGLEPITVYVSRKDGRAYIRQGFTPLADGEAVIRDPARAIGTHVFTATDAGDGGASLRWTGLTVPETSPPRTSATDALDRISFGPEIAAEIGRRLFSGATLIISDHGISNETGKGTDFVVLTR